MSDKTCDRCNRVFKTPDAHRRHQARKTPCAPILGMEDAQALYGPVALADPNIAQRQCKFCCRVYASYTSMRRHVRTSCKIAPNTRNGETGMSVLYDHTIRKQQAQIAHLTALVEKQTSCIDKQSTLVRQLLDRQDGQTVVVGASDGAQVAIDNHRTIVNINVFGRERLDHATSAHIREILDESRAAPSLPAAAQTAVLKAAMLIYSDPDHPENYTCYLPNKKTNDVLVHAEDGWEIQPAALVLPPMAVKGVDVIFDRQPYEDAERYGQLLTELRDNEQRYTTGAELRPILVRNKELLARALKTLPVAGGLQASS